MDVLDKQIRDFFTRETLILRKGNRLKVDPSVEDFYEFVMDKLEGKALEGFLDYLQGNPEAQEMVRQARALVLNERESEKETVPADWVQQAKDLALKNYMVRCPYCAKPITPFKKPLKTQNLYNLLWLALSAAAFLFSFAYRRYFFQCLALALFFGIKWAVDQKSTKTQILIYKSLKDDVGGHSRDLHNTKSHL